MKVALPFVGREAELARLRRLHAQCKHVLLVGAPGAGKSALVRHLREPLRLCVCPDSERLAGICDALERELGLKPARLRLVQRKNRLLRLLAEAKRAVVFDDVNRTTPRLASFIECVSERVPVWLATRSEHSWDIGHFWPLLSRFERVELRPFRLEQTRALVEATVRRGLIPALPQALTARLHRLAGGNASRLCDLLARLCGHHHLASPRGLRLLELDRRIELLSLPPDPAPAEP